MKSKPPFQIFVLLTLLFSPFGANQPVHVRTRSVEKLDVQIIDRHSFGSQGRLQLQSAISMIASPSSVNIGEMTTVTVNLNNVPVEGYASSELTCTYDPNLVEVSSIVPATLFGADPVVAIHGPQDGQFIVAIAGSQGKKAKNNGKVMTFNLIGLQASQPHVACQARVSTGGNALTSIKSAATSLTVMGNTPTPTFEPVPCDKAEFIADINVPPGTVMAPSTEFIKTWRLKNVGSCTWTTSYRVQFLAGEQMNAPSSVRLPVNVAPGQTFDISLYMTAPATIGTHRGYWILYNDTGKEFGIGLQGNQPWFVDIVVSNVTTSVTPSVTAGGPTPTSAATATPLPGTYFDFVAEAHMATWSSAAGQLPYPGIDGNSNGFAFKVENPRLETGAVDTRPGLLMSPQNIQNAYIQGSYPPIHVQSGDRFQSMIGCEGGAPNCYVAFRLDYQVGSDYPRTFWGPFLERYDGQTFSVNIDLSPLAGKDVRFTLTILAFGGATDDRALWVAPIIYRPNPSWTPTPSATPAVDWLTFTNRRYSFELKYPPPGPIIANNDTFATIHLPFVQGTALQDKSLYITAYENVNTCMGAFPLPQSSDNVTINGIPFLKQTGQDSGAGHLFRWISYSTPRNNVCVSLNFILDFLNPGTPATPPAVYDEAAESAIFEQIVATYRWLEITPTITPVEPPINTSTPTGTLIPTTGTINGQVLAGKPVTIELYNTDHTLITSVAANADGTFSLTAPAGAYSILASADGFLSAKGDSTITGGGTSTVLAISLLHGDLDSNNVIDQFDALTIGMNYNAAFPAAADLNNDGMINILDLELLAKNYRKTGPVPWE